MDLGAVRAPTIWKSYPCPDFDGEGSSGSGLSILLRQERGGRSFDDQGDGPLRESGISQFECRSALRPKGTSRRPPGEKPDHSRPERARNCEECPRGRPCGEGGLPATVRFAVSCRSIKSGVEASTSGKLPRVPSLSDDAEFRSQRVCLNSNHADGYGGKKMNYSICNADRTTHFKIVVVALIFGIAAISLAISLHSRPNIRASKLNGGELAMMANPASAVIR